MIIGLGRICPPVWPFLLTLCLIFFFLPSFSPGFWHIVIDSDEGVMEALSGRC